MSPLTALITGATDGIGKATATRLARDGHEVVITGRSEARCEAAVAEIEAAAPGARVSYLVGDLSKMGDVVQLARRFREGHQRLDVLLLNANSITQTHTLTEDGFEANLAVGYLGRVLLTWSLADVLRKTGDASVLTVVGLNLERIDFDDPSSQRGFSSMSALGRWQWAMQVFAREHNRTEPDVAMNVYMPGLVKTKILANEPQPMRLVVQIASALMGVPVDRAGDELAQVIVDIRQNGRRDGYFNRTRLEPPRRLKDQPGDGPRLVELTRRLLSRWLAG